MYNLDEDETLLSLKPTQLTSTINNEAFINGYCVGRELYDLANIVKNKNLKKEDFGITTLMMHFADFYSKGQYPLFVDAFLNLKELGVLEVFLLKYNKSKISLPLDMATDSRYSIKKNLHLFENCELLTLSEFNNIITMMQTPNITADYFINLIKKYHLHVIESFYIFTSITKHCKVIKECRDLNRQSLNYTFPKVLHTSDSGGDCAYWFLMPPRAVWFAYYRGSIKYSTYITRDIERLLDNFTTFCNIKCIVVGVISNNTTMYPLFFEDPMYRFNWDATVNLIQNLGLNCIYQKNDPTKLNVNMTAATTDITTNTAVRNEDVDKNSNKENLTTVKIIKKLFEKNFHFVKYNSDLIYKRKFYFMCFFIIQIPYNVMYKLYTDIYGIIVIK